jgi:hypothetical protein
MLEQKYMLTHVVGSKQFKHEEGLGISGKKVLLNQWIKASSILRVLLILIILFHHYELENLYQQKSYLK